MSLMKMSSPQKGFSLVQVAALVAVAGIIMVAVIPGGGGGSDAAKRDVTLQRMKAIEEATKAFMIKNARRPCPADGTLAISNASFGTEFNSGSCDPDSTNPNFEYSTTVDSQPVKVVAGIVPVRALGLPDEYALDGWGRRMMYIVDYRATVAGLFTDVAVGTAVSTFRTCFDVWPHNLRGHVKIYNSFSDSSSGYLKDEVMWALISYGKSGHGAFPAQGSGVTSRIDATAGVAAALSSAAYLNAFVNTTTGAVASTSFAGQLVQQNADIATKYDTIVWYNEDTKNTCAIGRDSVKGTYMNLNSASSAANFSVATATGDFNADGIQDLLIGNFGDSTPKAYVLLGRKNGWPVGTSIARTDITSGKGGFSITNDMLATTLVDYFGLSVAMGDVNGDGYDDAIIGGEMITIVFGRSNTNIAALSGNLNISSLTGSNGILIYFDSAGPSMVAAGDTVGNGSGRKDVLFTKQYGTNSGVFVVKNRADWTTVGCIVDLALPMNDPRIWSIASTSLCGQPAITNANGYWIWDPFASGYPVGSFNLTTGYVNSDIYEDIILSETVGYVYALMPEFSVSSGVAFGIPDYVAMGAGMFTGAAGGGVAMYASGGSGATLGVTLASADMNNDGLSDIITSNTERIYGYTSPTGTAVWSPAVINLATASTSTWPINTNTSKPAWLTFYLPNNLKVGDVNGDGRKDLLIGATGSDLPSSCTTKVGAGSVYVLYQPAAGFTTNLNDASATAMFDSNSTTCDTAELNSTNFDGFRIDGAVAGHTSFIPAIADLNADGKNDLIIGSTGYDAGTSFTGRVHLLWGRRSVAWETAPGTNVYTLPTGW